MSTNTDHYPFEKQFIVAEHADLCAQLEATMRMEDIAWRRMFELDRQIKAIEALPWWKEVEDAR